jgi:hypothetical protein
MAYRERQDVSGCSVAAAGRLPLEGHFRSVSTLTVIGSFHGFQNALADRKAPRSARQRARVFGMTGFPAVRLVRFGGMRGTGMEDGRVRAGEQPGRGRHDRKEMR